MDTLLCDEEHELDRPVEHWAIPTGFVPVRQRLLQSLDRKLGYHRNARFVFFYYEPRGGEVVWNDGQSYGFGCGSWMTFLDDVAPLGRRQGINLGNDEERGDHVLVIDRELKQAWFADFGSAETLVDRQNSAAA